jgi:hypothetical protein
MRTVRGEHGRQDVVGERVARADAEPSGLRGTEGQKALPREIHLRQDPFGMLEERRAGFGEVRGASVSDEEQLPELALQMEHRLAHRRLRLPQGPRRTREAQLFRDHCEGQQAVGVEWYLHS